MDRFWFCNKCSLKERYVVIWELSTCRETGKCKYIISRRQLELKVKHDILTYLCNIGNSFRIIFEENRVENSSAYSIKIEVHFKSVLF